MKKESLKEAAPRQKLTTPNYWETKWDEMLGWSYQINKLYDAQSLAKSNAGEFKRKFSTDPSQPLTSDEFRVAVEELEEAIYQFELEEDKHGGLLGEKTKLERLHGSVVKKEAIPKKLDSAAKREAITDAREALRLVQRADDILFVPCQHLEDAIPHIKEIIQDLEKGEYDYRFEESLKEATRTCFNCGKPTQGPMYRWYHADQDDLVCKQCAIELKHTDTDMRGRRVYDPAAQEVMK